MATRTASPHRRELGTGPATASRRNCSSLPTSCARTLEPSDYKHVVLGLIFLKHISNSFEAKHAALLAEDAAVAEDPDEYLAENVFWVPKEARDLPGDRR